VLIKKSLTPEGVYILNFTAEKEGENKIWLDSLIKTFSLTFPNHYIIYLDGASQLKNIMLVGINSEKKIDEKNLEKEIVNLDKESNGKLKLGFEYQPLYSENSAIFSDDFSPVERLTAPIISNYINTYASWFYSLR